jgi:hypothetical protein
MTIVLLVALWVAVSVPASLVVGCILRAGATPELIGMDGSDAVFVDGDGQYARVPLLTPSH